MSNEQRPFAGLYAHNLRVKITQEPRYTNGGALILPGQIGFKNGQSWANRWCDVFLSQELLEHTPMQFEKGAVVLVNGRYNERDDEYQGQTRERRTIFAETISLASQQQQQQRGYNQRQPPQQQQQHTPPWEGGQQGGGMDDVPF